MRTTISINLNLLLQNYNKIHSLTNKKIIAVVKSNAYGHGLIECSKVLDKAGASAFLVTSLNEAIELRNNNITKTILLLEQTSSFYDLYKNKISLCITSIEQLRRVCTYPKQLKLHLKLETGLNRLGLLENDIDEAITLISKTNHQIEGLYTHISSKENYPNQLEKFKKMSAHFSSFKIKMIHINSSNYVLEDDRITNYIRVGLALYGYSDSFEVHPILSLYSPIYRKIEINKNQKVGYFEHGVTPSNGYLFTIPFGYADGWYKYIKTKAFSNQMIQEIGDTSMDLMTFFSPDKFNGNYLEIIGENITLLEHSKNSGLSPYEILSSLSYRLERKYIK